MIKFGFESATGLVDLNTGMESHKVFGITINNKGSSLVITEDGIFILSTLLSQTEPESSFMKDKIQYVHSLQNLYFALTQEELTFKKWN